MRLEIKEGNLYVDGQKTNDPLLIGYSILDMTEKGSKASPKGAFILGQTVYYRTDVNQDPQLIVGIVERPGYISYLISDRISEKECFEMELSTEKIIY
jgi:hypothetical protein